MRTPVLVPALLVAVLSTSIAPSALSQSAAPAAPAAPAPLATPDQQVAAAVLPLPEPMRAGATVLGYREAGRLVQLRKGTNGMICLADDPGDDRFHAACYADAMEPFMARGRALRAAGVSAGQVDSVRFREVREGKLAVPKTAAALWSLTGQDANWDRDAGTVTGARPLYVIYVPFATEASTGIPATPTQGTPWLMHPGTPKAHVMFVPRM